MSKNGFLENTATYLMFTWQKPLFENIELVPSSNPQNNVVPMLCSASMNEHLFSKIEWSSVPNAWEKITKNTNSIIVIAQSFSDFIIHGDKRHMSWFFPSENQTDVHL